MGFDTDVNGSALGEATWGITKGLENSVYITIGTGVGMGIMSNGKLLHGMLHPEAGHILMRENIRKIITKANAHITKPVWKVWLQARRSKHAGAKKE